MKGSEERTHTLWQPQNWDTAGWLGHFLPGCAVDDCCPAQLWDR